MLRSVRSARLTLGPPGVPAPRAAGVISRGSGRRGSVAAGDLAPEQRHLDYEQSGHRSCNSSLVKRAKV